MVRSVGGSDSLREVAAAVVNLEEESARVAHAAGEATVPDIRHEQRNIARLGNDWHWAGSVPRERVVGAAIAWWCLARGVVFWDHSGWSGFEWAVHQENVAGNREDRIRNPLIPWNFSRARRTVWRNTGEARDRGNQIPRPITNSTGQTPLETRISAAVSFEVRLGHSKFSPRFAAQVLDPSR